MAFIGIPSFFFADWLFRVRLVRVELFAFAFTGGHLGFEASMEVLSTIDIEAVCIRRAAPTTNRGRGTPLLSSFPEHG